MSLSCRHIALKSLLIALLFSLPTSGFAQNGGPVRVAVVGLVHGHVQGFLHNLPSHPNVELVGISEPDAALRQKYAALFHLNESLFFPSEAAMLAATHPQAILVYTSITDHRAAIEQRSEEHTSELQS